MTFRILVLQLQHCNGATSECKGELVPAMPSESTVDEVSGATANVFWREHLHGTEINRNFVGEILRNEGAFCRPKQGCDIKGIALDFLQAAEE